MQQTQMHLTKEGDSRKDMIFNLLYQIMKGEH